MASDQLLDIALTADPKNWAKTLKAANLPPADDPVRQALLAFSRRSVWKAKKLIDDANIVRIGRFLQYLDLDLAHEFFKWVDDNISSFKGVNNEIRLKRSMASILNNKTHFGDASVVKTFPERPFQTAPHIQLNRSEKIGKILQAAALGLSEPALFQISRFGVATAHLQRQTPYSKELVDTFNASSTHKVAAVLPGRAMEIALLQNVWITEEPSAVVYNRDERVFFNEAGADTYNHVAFCGRTKTAKRDRKIEIAFVATRIGLSNYYHSLIDRGPIAYAYKSMKFNFPIVWCGDLEDVDRQLLDLLGIDASKVISGAEAREVVVEKALMPIAPSFREGFIHELRDGRSIAHGESRSERKVFISRQDSGARAPKNIAAFEDAVAAQGWEMFLAKGRSLEEQQEFFKDATVIAGMHGAGLANAIFAPEGAQVIEIHNPNYLNGLLAQLQSSCGHYYYPIILDQRVEHGWEINIDDVVKKLEDSAEHHSRAMTRGLDAPPSA